VPSESSPAALESRRLQLLFGLAGGSLASAALSFRSLQSSAAPSPSALGEASASEAADLAAVWELLQLCGKTAPTLSTELGQQLTELHAFVGTFSKSGCQLLLGYPRALLRTSPEMVADVFTPEGNFTLGFWLYVPADEQVDTQGHRLAGKRVHLLSRVPETGECNLVDLFRVSSSRRLTSHPNNARKQSTH